ncbi:MAG: TerC family protein [Gammaproteobacteria bacterium]|nr:TerC family protein [Gammaproteobacteria bacterium]
MDTFIDIALSLTTLTILELVLGIDNLVFLAIITQKLPKHLQRKARQLGLTLAWVTRLILLASALALTQLTKPLFAFMGWAFSGRDLFLLGGGIFLLAKATQEIHFELDPQASSEINIQPKKNHFFLIVIQIAILDIIFSLDSVLTAIGLTQIFWVMAVAITIAILAMIFVSEPLSRFIERHPTIKMLALSFLILIGTILIADGCGYHVPRGYIYFAMGFSLFIEFLNSLKRRRQR